MIKALSIVTMLLLFQSLNAQSLSSSPDILKLSNQQIDSLHNSDFYPRQYNHVENKVWTICACDSRNYFDFRFWNVSFDKSNKRLKINGYVKDSRTGKPFEDVRIYLGNTEGLKLIPRDQFDVSSSGTFNIDTAIEENDELYFYTYDVLNDGYYFHPLETFYLGRLLQM